MGRFVQLPLVIGAGELTNGVYIYTTTRRYLRLEKYISSGLIADCIAVIKDEMVHYVALNSIGVSQIGGFNAAIPGMTLRPNEVNALLDMNGVENTALIRAAFTSPACNLATAYSTIAVPSGWYVPALGELKIIVDNLDAVNNILDNIGKPKFSTLNGAISSTIYNISSTWNALFPNKTYLNANRGVNTYNLLPMSFFKL